MYSHPAFILILGIFVRLSYIPATANLLDIFHPTVGYLPNSYSNVDAQSGYQTPNTEENHVLSKPNNELQNNYPYGSYYPSTTPQPNFQGSLLLRMYCQGRRVISITVIGGSANVYCIRDREYLSTVIFNTLPKQGLVGNLLQRWLEADLLMQSGGYVPLCALHCQPGTRPTVTPGNFTQPMSTSAFSIGCSNIITAKCSAVCSDDIYELAHGMVTCTTDTHVGSTCSSRCFHGYTLMGPARKSCRTNLKWSDSSTNICLANDVADIIRNLMEYENLTVDDAMTQLRVKLETHLSKQAAPSTSRNSGVDSDSDEAKREMNELLETLLVKLSKSTTITLKHYSPSCSIEPKARHDCGYKGIPEQVCEERNCCWNASEDNTIWCFHKEDIRPPNYSTKLPESPYTFHNMQLPQQPVFVPQTGVQLLPTHLQPQHDFSALFPSPNPHPVFSPRTPNEDQCGCVAKQTTTKCLAVGGLQQERVFCGTSTTARRWPWHAIVYYGKRLCGGTLISRNFVVTAAHCFDPYNGVSDTDSIIEVYFGVTRRDRTDPGKQSRNAKRIIRHPLYHTRGEEFVQNDIALIQLSSPVDITNDVRMLCLPKTRRPIVGQYCFITGFGQQSESSDPSLSLLSASLPLISTARCKILFNDKVNSIQNLCAGKVGKNKSADACKGDSGGPLACHDGGSDDGCSWYLAGITSFGKEPCGTGWPGVYVNVAHYQSWILSHIGAGMVRF